MPLPLEQSGAATFTIFAGLSPALRSRFLQYMASSLDDLFTGVLFLSSLLLYYAL